MPVNAYRGTNETPNTRRANIEGAKHDSAATPPSNNNAKDQANQRTKKPCHSATTESTKRNVMEMGMFFLNKPDMKATDVFPKGMAQLVCVDFS